MRRRNNGNGFIALLLIIFLVLGGFYFYSQNKENVDNAINSIKQKLTNEIVQLNSLIDEKNEQLKKGIPTL